VVLYSAFVFGALRLAANQRDRALLVLAVLLAIVVGVLLIEGAEGGQLYGTLNRLFGHHHQVLRPDLARRDAARGCYPVALLFWPAALATSRRAPQWAAVLVVLGLMVSAATLGVDSPIAALGLSLLVFAGVQRFPRIAPVVLAVGVVAYFLIAPLPFLSHQPGAAGNLPSDIGKESWRIRIGIWRFASQLIAHKPLLGYGLDASRVYPDQIPMHPHDAAIQLWLETGVLGALLAGLFWGWLFLRIRAVGQGDATWTAAACGTASAYLLIGAVSFGVWQEWWLALGAVAAAACGMVLQQRRTVIVEDVAAGGLAALS
jgi:O-antigen ligase